MGDDQDLHGQVLCLSVVTPLAGGRADYVQGLQQDAGGDVGAAEVGQLPRLRHQDFLRQNL